MSQANPVERRPSSGRELGSRWRAPLLFLVGFAVYQTSLALSATKAYPDFWLFGADSYRMLLTQLGELHPMAVYQSKKHLALVVLGTPLHRLGDLLYSFAPEPFRENLALSFPGAIFGGLNLCVAHALFCKIGFKPGRALWPTVLYGTGTAIWIYASFPETYLLSTLASNVFILAFLHDPPAQRWKRLAIIQALACYCAPPQLALAVLPAVHRLRVEGPRSAVRFVLSYGLALTVLYVLPYLFLATLDPARWVAPYMVKEPVTEIQAMADWHRLMRISDWSIVIGAFCFLSQLGSFLPPLSYEGLTANLIWFSTPATSVVAIAVVSYVLCGALRPPRGESFVGSEAFAVFCAAYIASFVFLNPPEAFVYPAPFVLPLWLWIHGFHVKNQDRPAWRGGIALACVLCAFLNATYVLSIDDHDPGYGRVRTSRLAPEAEGHRPGESVARR